MKFLVCVPVWGERCWRSLLDSVWPALRRASAGHDCRFLVHTDDLPLAQRLFAGYELIVCSVPADQSLGTCEREAIDLAVMGEYICRVNSDMVMSIDTFTATAKRIAEGKRMICCPALRCDDSQLPPVGVDARTLLAWAWDHRHQHIKDTTWGSLNSNTFTHLHFERYGNVVLRSFFLHIWCTLKEPRTKFSRSTIDWDLPEAFEREEIHIVTEPDELGFAELSPPGYLVVNSEYNLQAMVHWAATQSLSRQRWMFQHRICLRGRPIDCGDLEVGTRIESGFAGAW